jgi:hypothetical protein
MYFLYVLGNGLLFDWTGRQIRLPLGLRILCYYGFELAVATRAGFARSVA